MEKTSDKINAVIQYCENPSEENLKNFYFVYEDILKNIENTIINNNPQYKEIAPKCVHDAAFKILQLRQKKYNYYKDAIIYDKKFVSKFRSIILSSALNKCNIILNPLPHKLLLLKRREAILKFREDKTVFYKVFEPQLSYIEKKILLKHPEYKEIFKSVLDSVINKSINHILNQSEEFQNKALFNTHYITTKIYKIGMVAQQKCKRVYNKEGEPLSINITKTLYDYYQNDSKENYDKVCNILKDKFEDIINRVLKRNPSYEEYVNTAMMKAFFNLLKSHKEKFSEIKELMQNNPKDYYYKFRLQLYIRTYSKCIIAEKKEQRYKSRYVDNKYTRNLTQAVNHYDYNYLNNKTIECAKECVHNALKILNHRDKDLLCKYYFGLDQFNKPYTFEALAKENGVSRQYVNLLINNCINKIKSMLNVDGNYNENSKLADFILAKNLFEQYVDSGVNICSEYDK